MKLALNSNFTNDAYIYKLLKNKILDNFIIKLDNRKTNTTTKSIIKKGYLTANEQFIDLLNNFIICLDTDFYFLGKYRNIIIEIILGYEENYKFILCKNYWGDNSFIPYFKYNIKKIIVTGFYNNIKMLIDESEDIKGLLKIEKINFDKISLKQKKDVDKLYNLLKYLTVANSNKYCLLYLFTDFDVSVNEIIKTYELTTKKVVNANKKHYIIQWEMIIKNYYIKKDAISYILN